jgi:hypothetical protein
MKKEQLVQAILKNAKKRSKSLNGSGAHSVQKSAKPADKKGMTRIQSHTRRKSSQSPTSTKSLDVERTAIAEKLDRESRRREKMKDLALAAAIEKESRQVDRDRLVLIVRDPYWLQVYWEVTPTTIARARTSLEKHWRGARPVLRLYEVVEVNDSPAENLVREIEVHGGVDTWYIDTPNPPKTYRAAIGFVTTSGKFFSVAKSNRVNTPNPNACGHSTHWADIAKDCENIFAMSGGYDPKEETGELREVFEEKLKRPMIAMGPNHAALLDHHFSFPFEVDAQMVVYGVAVPGSSVTVAGEPVKVDPNGNFSVRLELPDKRQVLPVVASSRDGSQQRTTVLAVERNTKVMETLNIENDDM